MMRHSSQSSSSLKGAIINVTYNNNFYDTGIFPDLIVRKCPVDDCSKCAMIYVNKLIGHRIICRCPCGHDHSAAKKGRIH